MFCYYIYKIEFWCELTIAILIQENVDLGFGQKYTLMSRLDNQRLDQSFQFVSDPSNNSNFRWQTLKWCNADFETIYRTKY